MIETMATETYGKKQRNHTTTHASKPPVKDHKKSAELCPVAKKCGGCQLQGVSYEKQLEKKRKLVK